MPYQTSFSITESGDIQVPVVIKERHFVEDYEPKRAIIQATGREFLITIWSPRDLVEIRLPLAEWKATKPYGRSLSSERINVNRWVPCLDTETDGGNMTITGTVSGYDSSWTPEDPRQ